MAITEAQATRIAAYYEARKPYTKLLFEAMQDRADATDTETGNVIDTTQQGAERAQPQPGAHFAELVELLKESKIAGVEGAKKVAKRKL